eukprot:4207665-Ditylum_brightwellii.AAC.1
MHHINAAWKTAASGYMENICSSKWWTGWVQHCMGCGINPFLHDVPIHEEKTNILMAFASQTRASNFRRGHRVHQGSVDCTLWDVAHIMVYAGVGDPRQAGGAAKQTLDLPIHRILQKYKQ